MLGHDIDLQTIADLDTSGRHIYVDPHIALYQKDDQGQDHLNFKAKNSPETGNGITGNDYLDRFLAERPAQGGGTCYGYI
jgi:hypothetical protein